MRLPQSGSRILFSITSDTLQELNDKSDTRLLFIKKLF